MPAKKICIYLRSCVKFRDKKAYYGQHDVSLLSNLYAGANINISMAELYAVEFNSSTYQFRSPAQSSSEVVNLGVVETTLMTIYGWDGSNLSNDSHNQLGLTRLASNAEECVSFAFLSGKGAQRYKLKLQMFAEPGVSPSLKGYMTLPNKARSFDRFRLFKSRELPENRETTMDYSVYSLKLLQKRSTDEEPCVDVDNYDKVMC
jgi:hypothetical protein